MMAGQGKAKINQPPEYDSPWKEMLTQFFPAFMQFFYGDIFAEIDWTRGFEFLDKELQKITVKGKLGKRLADKLVKVYLRNGREVWVLIHVEIQGQREANFGRRMFVYHYRIFDAYGQRVISLAVLTDEDQHWRPNNFSYNLFGTGVSLNFRAVKLLDRLADWSALEKDVNPFAVIVMAHLKALETKAHPQKRFRQKLEIIKGLYERGLQQEDIRQLFRFIDWVMTLPIELETKLETEVKALAEEQKMEYISGMERRAIERGLRQGMQQGMQQGVQQGLQQGLLQGIQQGQRQSAATIILRLLNRRLGALTPTGIKRIESLSVTQLETLTDALLDFSTMSDLNKWLRENGKSAKTTKVKK